MLNSSIGHQLDHITHGFRKMMKQFVPSNKQENKKYVLWTAGICPVAKIVRITASHAKLHQTRQLAAELSPKKTIFKWCRTWSSVFKTFISGHMTITEFQICSCAPHFTKIRRLFVEMWQFYDFQDGSQLPVMLLVCNDYVQVVYVCVSVTSNIIWYLTNGGDARGSEDNCELDGK